ncbi:MAG: hypothetical protein U0165_03570 [Polyangiaceae bacterium]
MDLFQSLTAWERELNRSNGAVGLLNCLDARNPMTRAQLAKHRTERLLFDVASKRALVQAQLTKAFQELTCRVAEVGKGLIL